MDQQEAERIASAIRKSRQEKRAPFVVHQVELNKMNGKYEVRCDYSGESKRYGGHVLTGGTCLQIKSPGEWALLKSIWLYGQPERK
jgi:hypothetical protein